MSWAHATWETEGQIRSLSHRYAQAFDNRDVSGLEACFFPDAELIYAGERFGNGVEDLILLMRRAKAFIHTSHNVGTVVITGWRGDTALVRSYTVAYLVTDGESGPKLLMRGVHYDDEVDCQSGTWRISKRVHTVDWASEIPTELALGLPQELAD